MFVQGPVVSLYLGSTPVIGELVFHGLSGGESKLCRLFSSRYRTSCLGPAGETFGHLLE